jgi:DNA-binding IscR family transcriptional regulator
MRLSVRVAVAAHILLVTRFYSDTVRVTGRLLTRSTGCNPVIIRTIVLSLKKAGILSVKRGASGGAALLKPPEETSLWDIAEAVDPVSAEDFVSCVHGGASKHCPVGRHIQDILKMPFQRIAEAVKTEMKAITLEDLSKMISVDEISAHKRAPAFLKMFP